MKKEINLPDMPSDLIDLALKDLDLCFNDNKYCVDMMFFHLKFKEDEKCHVCLAGSVLAKSLNGNINRSITDGLFSFSDKIKNKIYGLNSLRIGDITEGVESMIPQDLFLQKQSQLLDLEDEFSCIELDFRVLENSVSFKKEYDRLVSNMKKIAKRLRGIGL